MSTSIEDLRKRNLKVREFKNQYKLGLRVLLPNENSANAFDVKFFEKMRRSQDFVALYKRFKSVYEKFFKLELKQKAVRDDLLLARLHSHIEKILRGDFENEIKDTEDDDEDSTIAKEALMKSKSQIDGVDEDSLASIKTMMEEIEENREKINETEIFDKGLEGFEYNDKPQRKSVRMDPDSYLNFNFNDLDDLSSSSEESTEESKRLSDGGYVQSTSNEGANTGDGSSDSDSDIKNLDPSKVNWLKYIFEKHVKPKDPDYDTLSSPVIMNDILGILLIERSDDEIQNDLVNTLGFERIDMLGELIGKRGYIKEYCQQLSDEIVKEKGKSSVVRDPHRFGQGVTVTYGDTNKKKGQRKQKKDKNKGPQASNHEMLSKLGFNDDFIEENYKLGLKEQVRGDHLLKGYQNPYYSSERKGQEYRGEKSTGKVVYGQTEFDEPDWKEIHLTPPAKKITEQRDLIEVKSLPMFMHKAFKTTNRLNAIQSIVFDKAFNSKGNILVAAPTGAGKTNIALLTVMREIKMYAEMVDGKEPDMTGKPMKIIYLAPLKALASEIVAKFGAALGYLKIKVRELTGDMNLTKMELIETHVIVTTPEKWDVVTRKSDSLMSEVNLVIIDEIHLLNDERGTVLE